jgi:hypothetical protein
MALGPAVNDILVGALEGFVESAGMDGGRRCKEMQCDRDGT